jgi:RNA polymerase-binding transcription factor DksA
MATSRKSASRRTQKPKSSSGSKHAKRPAAAAAKRPATAAKPMKKSGAKPAARPPVSIKSKAKPVVVAKPVAGKGAAMIKGAAMKGAAIKGAAVKGVTGKGVPAKFVKGKGPLRAVGSAKPPAPVRPIGVLPPDAIARGAQKPAHPVAIVSRPKAAVAQPIAAPTGDRGVTAKDYPTFEKLLLAERQRVLKEMGHLENTVLKINQRDSAGDLSGYSFHMADVGTDAMEREKAFLFASAEGRILMEINEALRRIHRGEYGVCEICGNSIGRGRLEAMLYARLCLSCKEKEEKAARGAQ